MKIGDLRVGRRVRKRDDETLIMKIGFVIFVTLSIFLCSSVLAETNEILQAEHQVEMGLEQIREHDWEKAFVYFDNAVKLDPAHQLAWANHGTSHLNLGRPQEAIKSYKKARELDPSDPYVYCSLGSANIRLSKPNEAMKYIDQAIALDPSFWPALMNKAGLLISLGKDKEAEVYYLKALEINPDIQKPFVDQPQVE